MGHTRNNRVHNALQSYHCEQILLVPNQHTVVHSETFYSYFPVTSHTHIPHHASNCWSTTWLTTIIKNNNFSLPFSSYFMLLLLSPSSFVASWHCASYFARIINQRQPSTFLPFHHATKTVHKSSEKHERKKIQNKHLYKFLLIRDLRAHGVHCDTHTHTRRILIKSSYERHKKIRIELSK